MLKMLKSLMQNESAIIPILSGTERLAHITRFDPQVNRRLTKVVPKPLCQGVDDVKLSGLIDQFCGEVNLKPGFGADLPGRLIYASRSRFGRAVETILNAIECAIDEDAESLTSVHFAEFWGMQEGCPWDRNVFVASDWAGIDLDAGADAFETERTTWQTRLVEER